MKPLCTFIFGSLLLLCTAQLSAGEWWGGHFSKLKTRIIRSLAIAPTDQNLVVVGNKGSSTGDATLFASDDGGVSWRFINGGQPLASTATDVQAVAFVSPTVLLAGTWKHGLYRSEDAGRRFTRVSNFPDEDVRSILRLASGRVLAATGASGIWKSDDAGASWSATAQSGGYFWSLKTGAHSSVFATSPNTGLYRSTDAGDSWQLIYPAEGLYEAASIDSMIAAVGEQGLALSANNGNSWEKVLATKGVRLSSIDTDQADFVIGSWTEGLLKYSTLDATLSRYVQGLAALHVKATDQGILVGSWGKGLHILPRSRQTKYLIAAARAAQPAVIDELLTTGADANTADRNKNTALIYAARDGHQEIAVTLLRAGADVNWIDGEGVTPLILAAFKNHPTMVRLLLDNGADKSVVDNFGKTALDYALQRSSSDAVAALLRNK